MKAAIIRITDLIIDCNKTNILEQIQDIVDDLDVFSFIEFKDQESLNFLILQTLMNSIPREDLERTVIDNQTESTDTRLKYNVGATVANIFESQNYLYAAYYVAFEDLMKNDSNKDSEQKNVKINMFGSQICSADVASDLIIVKHDLMYDVRDLNIATSMSLSNVDEYTFIRDIMTIFNHRGLIIDPDDKKSEYFYIQNPLENIILTESDYEKFYRFHEYEVFNYQLTVFVDIRCNADNSKLNETVSRVTNSKVYGRALLSLSKRPEFRENPDFADLTDTRFDMIMYLKSRGPDTTPSISKSDAYANFDKILELAKIRYSTISMKSLNSLTNILNEDK